MDQRAYVEASVDRVRSRLLEVAGETSGKVVSQTPESIVIAYRSRPNVYVAILLVLTAVIPGVLYVWLVRKRQPLAVQLVASGGGTRVSLTATGRLAESAAGAMLTAFDQEGARHAARAAAIRPRSSGPASPVFGSVGALAHGSPGSGGTPRSRCCTNCGKDLGDGSRFCTGCGAPVTRPAQPEPSQKEIATAWKPVPLPSSESSPLGLATPSDDIRRVGRGPIAAATDVSTTDAKTCEHAAVQDAGVDEAALLTVVEESEEPVATGPLATLCLEFPDHVESVEIVHESDQYVIGRDGGSCQAEIKDPRASRRHLAIVWTKEGPSVLDLGSTNGSELNGERLGDEPLLLSEGDAIGIGRCRLIVREITVPE